jgi:catechol 2,3-dioxygenase-like lactoylglutathione lyase family enzyme
MLHHLSFGVRDLGFRRVFDGPESIGYGLVDNQDQLLLNLEPQARAPGPGFHLAFDAPTRAAVDAFHAQALRVGGRDNGAPGLRPDYGPHYYAAFLVDPDGHRIEAVCKQAQP